MTTKTSGFGPSRRAMWSSRDFIIYGLGLALIYLALVLGLPTFPVFLGLFAVTVLALQPGFSLSPLTILYGYYGAWFVAAPLFADIYAGALTLHEYNVSFAFAYSVFGLGVIMLRAGENFAVTARLPRLPDLGAPSEATLNVIIIIFYVLATAFVALIIAYSGGLSVWLENPGKAFLNRQGTGVFVIASHFTSLALASATAYKSVRTRTIWPAAVFILWVIATSAVHGSKLQIALLLILALAPWLVNARFWSWTTFSMIVGGIAVFLAGMLMRGQNLFDLNRMVVSSLNYFTALQNLAISIRDFEPNFMQTFFLPFNKIGMTLGWVDHSAYFDMNHMLTDKYYPARWALRATEQWPVETDLYLNFHFFFGLPIIAAFFAFHGWLYGFARRVNSAGAWFAAIMLSLNLISHLRGSLYNHTDFFMLPYILAMFVLFNGWRWTPVVPRPGLSGAIPVTAAPISTA